MNRPITGAILNIDKPYGMTSMEVVRRIKRASSVKRVGHGGTLDPIATGVVPVCVGQATRVMEYVIAGSKVYTGDVVLGISTDTYDAMGEVTSERDASAVTRRQAEEALRRFEGRVDQVPPMYSALKRGGRRLYDLAREGIEVERESRPVVVHEIRLEGWAPPVARVRVSCGQGFYMRSLAHDMGELLGCGGHLKSLVRRSTGPFRLDESASLEDAQRSIQEGTWADLVYSPDCVLQSMRTLILGIRLQKAVRNGRPIPPDVPVHPGEPDERCRAYGTDGQFIAIMRFDAKRRQWLPDKVFSF